MGGARVLGGAKGIGGANGFAVPTVPTVLGGNEDGATARDGEVACDDDSADLCGKVVPPTEVTIGDPAGDTTTGDPSGDTTALGVEMLGNFTTG